MRVVLQHVSGHEKGEEGRESRTDACGEKKEARLENRISSERGRPEETFIQ